MGSSDLERDLSAALKHYTISRKIDANNVHASYNQGYIFRWNDDGVAKESMLLAKHYFGEGVTEMTAAYIFLGETLVALCVELYGHTQITSCSPIPKAIY